MRSGGKTRRWHVCALLCAAGCLRVAPRRGASVCGSRVLALARASLVPLAASLTQPAAVAGDQAHSEQGGCKQGQILLLLQPADWPYVPLLLQVVRRTCLRLLSSHRVLSTRWACYSPRAPRDGVLTPSLRRQGGCARTPCGKYRACAAAVASQCDCRAAHSVADRSPHSWCPRTLARSSTRGRFIVNAATANLFLAPTPMRSPLSGALALLRADSQIYCVTAAHLYANVA